MNFRKATGSKQPRKQRKALYEAPLHAREKKVRCHLSKELRQKLGSRSARAKKGDKVKILRGKYKKHVGKIVEVDVANAKIFVEGVVKSKEKKARKQEAFIAIEPSNAIIIETDRKPKEKPAKQRGNE